MKLFEIIVILAIISTSISSFAKTKQFSVKDYQNDLTYLYNILDTTHPDIAYTVGKFTYEKKKLDLYNSIDNKTTPKEFFLRVKEFVSSFGDAHTRIWYDWTFLLPKQTGYLSTNLKVMGDKLIYFDSNSKKRKALELKDISGIPVNDFIDTGMKYFSHETKSYAIGEALYCLENYKCANLIFGIKTNKIKYSFINSDKIVEIQYAKSNNNDVGKRQSEFINCEYFCFQHIPKKKTTYLRFNRNNDKLTETSRIDGASKERRKQILNGKTKEEFLSEIPIFKDEMLKMFEEMNEKHSKNLIIDLRYHYGGNSNLNNQLLYMITKKNTLKDDKVIVRNSNYLQSTRSNPQKVVFPEYYFNILDYNPFDDIKEGRYKINEEHHGIWTGKIYVLVGEETFSSSVDLAAMFKDNHLAIIAGQPTGGAPTSFGDSLEFELPNTKNTGTVSFKFFIRPNGDMKIAPLMPDWKLKYKNYRKYNWSPDAEILYVLDKI